MIPFVTPKPTANEATSAAATPSAHGRDACTGEPASRSLPKDLNIGGAAAFGWSGSLEDAGGFRATSVRCGETMIGRGAGGEGSTAGGGATIVGAAIGRDVRAPRCRMPLSTSRLAPFSNRASTFENSFSDAKGGASTASSPRAMV